MDLFDLSLLLLLLLLLLLIYLLLCICSAIFSSIILTFLSASINIGLLLLCFITGIIFLPHACSIQLQRPT